VSNLMHIYQGNWNDLLFKSIFRRWKLPKDPTLECYKQDDDTWHIKSFDMVKGIKARGLL